MGGDGATTAAPANQPHKHIMYYHNPPNSPTVALTHTTTQPHFTSLLLDALPNTSVVFCFCNEPALSLHNSMYSVIDRSPPHLLHEIILVDDGSDAPHLQAPLEVATVDMFTFHLSSPVQYYAVATRHVH
jgi:hypothetical protein